MTDETSGAPPLSPRLRELLDHTTHAAEMIRDMYVEGQADGTGEGGGPLLTTYQGTPADPKTYESMTFWIAPGEHVHPPDRAASVLTTVLVSGFFDVEFAVFAFEAWYQMQPATEDVKLERGDLSRMAAAGDTTVLTSAMALGFDVKGENFPNLSVMYRQPTEDETDWVKQVVLPGNPHNRSSGHVQDMFLRACGAPHTVQGQLMRHLLPAKDRKEVVAFLMRQQMVSHAAIASNRDDLGIDPGGGPVGDNVIAHDLLKEDSDG